MTLDALNKDLITAMKAKDMQTVSTLRYLLSKIKNQQIELRAKGEEVTEEGVQRIIKKLIKQRKEAIEGYTKVGNTEMVDKEKAELKVLESYFDASLFPVPEFHQKK